MTFKILCFDGGGARGIFQAALVRRLHDKLKSRNEQPEFWKKFDLVAGTSVGSIMAAGLTCGLTPSGLETIFMDRMEEAIPYTYYTRARLALSKMRVLRRFMRDDQKHYAKRLTKVLNPLAKLQLRRRKLAITATSLEDSQVRVFWEKRAQQDGILKVRDVVMASAALPGLFPPKKLLKRHYIDGGLWANNPSLAALILAIENRKKRGKIDLSEFRVVSIGTGYNPYRVTIAQYNAIGPTSKKYWEHLYMASAEADADTTNQAVGRILCKDWNRHDDDVRMAEEHEKTFLRIDAVPDFDVSAIDVRKAKKELPKLAEEYVQDTDVVDKLLAIVNEA